MSLKLNERYPARFNNPTAGYPQGSFKNRTTPTSKDGSYLEKDWANDKEGFFQSLLSAAGITANGAVDAVGASQFFDALQALKQTQAGTAFTTAGSAGSLTLAPTPAISAYAANQRFRVKFGVASTGSDTMNISGFGAKSIKQYNVSGYKVAASFAAGQLADVEYDGTDIVLLDQLPSIAPLPAGYFYGFKLANNIALPNTTIDVGPGSARDSTNTVDINLAATLRGILQSSGAWAAGDNQNKLDTGALAKNTTYHLFGIKKTGAGSDDIIYTTNIAGPAMPGGYAGSRYIQSFRTNVSGNIIPFFNRGAWMYYTTPIRDVNVTGQTPGNASTFPLSVPTGLVCEALVYAEIGGDNCALYLSSPDFPDLTPIGLGATYVGGNSIQAGGGSALEYSGQQQRIITNASAQIRARYTGQSAVANEIRIVTAGYKVAR
ncbi:hypothetical protein [Pseudomonas extremaustralis]|uniref:hypothetical protein n=1 Tax=Pseudomonas extremaustralis TaxID=359110 RepID=UPI0023079A16|nr:hypothetical protein [Pseudomonas extremaustralis]MDB1108061.1 hypothetical protein [Pseudomonas extremaustralis]